MKIKVVHLQLLSAGQGKVFPAWISLVQIARAFGQWLKARQGDDVDAGLQLIVYVYDPSVIFLLQLGAVDLAAELECSPIRVGVEIVRSDGGVSWQNGYVHPEALAREALNEFGEMREVAISLVPAPEAKFSPISANDIGDMTIGQLGVAAGTTIVLDYRKNGHKSVG